MSEWVSVVQAADLKPGDLLDVEVWGEPVVLAKTEDGEFLATSDVCSHEYVLLHDGWLEGDEVECPQHGSKFNMRTGEVANLPATAPIATYEVKVEDDTVFLRAPKEITRD